MLGLFVAATVYGADGGSSSMGATLVLVVGPAAAVPFLVVFPTNSIFAEFSVTAAAEHAFIQLENPSGNAI